MLDALAPLPHLACILCIFAVVMMHACCPVLQGVLPVLADLLARNISDEHVVGAHVGTPSCARLVQGLFA